MIERFAWSLVQRSPLCAETSTSIAPTTTTAHTLAADSDDKRIPARNRLRWPPDGGLTRRPARVLGVSAVEPVPIDDATPIC